MGKLDEVGAHDAGDGAARAHGRNARVRVGEHLREAGRRAANQIEDQIFRRAENIFDVIAEDPEEPHVAQDMHPPAMQEHGCQQGEEAEVVRHQAIGSDKSIAIKRFERDLKEEDQHIDHDQQDRDDWSGIARLCIA